MNDKTPPTNIEAEESILGGILFDPNAFSQVKDKITPVMFSLRTHKIIYKVMVELDEKEQPTDLMKVSERLANLELLDTVGGTAKLGQLLNRTVSAVNCDRYAKLIFDKWKRRELIKLGHELVDLGYENAIDLPDLINRVKAELDSWIGSNQEDQENNLIGTMSYTATAHQHGEYYAETIKIEAEINLNSDPQAQIKKLQEQAESLLGKSL